MYNAVLRKIELDMGTEDTSDSELNTYGNKLFGTSFHGCFPRGQMPPMNENESCILNLDSASEAGTHWVAVYADGKKKLHVYDSFGRHVHGFSNSEADAEQEAFQRNCGQRCLAWLYVASISLGCALMV